MIEINLVPDVKQQLIKAKRVRTLVVSGAIMVGVVSIGIVILLGIYLFGVQTFRSSIADKEIEQKSQELAAVDDLANTVTVQHQLLRLAELHEQKNTTSRLFDVLTAVNPPAPNTVFLSLVDLNAESKTIRLEGQAANGYAAAEALKKTILGVKINYSSDGEAKSVPLTETVTTSEMNFSEDTSGKKVLRFTMSFVYDDSVFDQGLQNVVIARPDKQNATDSFLRLPGSLFNAQNNSLGGGE